MELADALLRREELPLGGRCGRPDSVGCEVPIHPRIISELPDATRLDCRIADAALEEARGWCAEDIGAWRDKSGYAKKPKAGIEASLGGLLRLARAYPSAAICNLELSGDCHLYDNISSAGGRTESGAIHSSRVLFTKEKFLEYSEDGEVADWGDGEYMCHAHLWLQHNVDTPEQALVLRNWAITYNNALLGKLY